MLYFAHTRHGVRWGTGVFCLKCAGVRFLRAGLNAMHACPEWDFRSSSKDTGIHVKLEEVGQATPWKDADVTNA